MIDPNTLDDSLSGCILCGRTPIVSVGYFIPVNGATYAAVVRLRDHPLRDGCTPTLGYGLCRKHARNVERSAAQVEARILAAAEQAVVH